MTTLLEKLITIIAPHECFICGIENNVICKLCSFELVDEGLCRCHVCGLPSAGYAPCNACRRRTSLDGMFVVGWHEEEMRQLVGLLKFEGKRQVARDMAPVLSSLLPQFDTAPLVVHVPTAYVRARSRGFDQAKLLAKELARIQKWNTRDIFRRISNTRQVGSSKKVRQRQAKEMFVLRPLHLDPARPILLVDDVVTTGASMEAAAGLLRSAGAERVYGAALARTR